MAMKLRNCQGIKTPGDCVPIDVFSNIDILEKILVRVPPEFISNSILVSKSWFGLIRSSYFREYYTRRWRHTLHLVGLCGFYVRDNSFLRTPLSQDVDIDSYDWENAHRFLSTHKEGGANDVVFGQHEYIIHSSRIGILLIGHQSYPFSLTVWNPFKKKLHQLPQLLENYRYGCTTFEVEYYGKGTFHYKVTRAKANMFDRTLDAVSIQTFSSKTGRWEETKVPSSPDLMFIPRMTGTVIRGVIYWNLVLGGISIYDPNRRTNQPLAFINSPDNRGSRPFRRRGVRYVLYGYAESGDGRLQCAYRCSTDMKIWVLEIEHGDYSNYKWSLRYKIDFNTLWKKNMSLCKGNYECNQFYWVSFLPQNSEYVFIRLQSRIFLLHMSSEKLEEFSFEDEGSSDNWWHDDGIAVIPYFKWACPWPNLLT